MRKAVRRIVLRMFPELSGGYHLDRYARILKISDPPSAGSVCDRFRPYWAADIEILTPEGEPAKNFPKYEAVPLPVPAAGHDEGFFLWPRPGTIVTVRWIEGRPDHPVICHIYPMGLSLPDVPDNMGKWQQRSGVHQFVDPDGNWERKTDKNIQDIAQDITETANGSRTETTGEDSTETVGGSKEENITESSNESVGNQKTITAQSFQVSASTITIGAPGGPSLIPLLISVLDDIKTALDIIATHTHSNIGVICSQNTGITERASSIGDSNTSLGTLTE